MATLAIPAVRQSVGPLVCLSVGPICDIHWPLRRVPQLVFVNIELTSFINIPKVFILTSCPCSG